MAGTGGNAKAILLNTVPVKSRGSLFGVYTIMDDLGKGDLAKMDQPKSLENGSFYALKGLQKARDPWEVLGIYTWFCLLR